MHASLQSTQLNVRQSLRRPARGAVALVCLLLLAGWPTRATAAGGIAMELKIPSLQDGHVPVEHTCDGADRSPQISWTALPEGTRSLALLMTDPDAPAGTWTHWVLFDVPSARHSLVAGVPPQPQLADGSRQGRNDFGRIGYGGPCPPKGPAHRYFFDLYALDSMLVVDPGATRGQVETAMHGHVLAHAQVMARYGR